MKTILIVSAVFPPEPVVSAKLSFDLAMAISNDKFGKVTVISPRPTRPYGFKFETTKPEVPFKHIQLNSFTCPQSSLTGRLKETYSFGKECYKYIEENHRDISKIYSNTWPLFAQYYTVKAARKFKIPIIIHVQDIYPESLSNKLPAGKSILNAILMPIDRFIFKHADSIIAISGKMREYLAKTRKIDINKIFVIQNWQDESDFIDHDKIININKKQKEPFTFMYLGNVGPVAGVDVLIDGFAQADIDNCRLVIAGAGSAKDDLITKAGKFVNKNIEFWPVPDGEVANIQALANVMMLPMKKGSASSSVPSKLPAYMLSKKPVLACVDAGSEVAEVLEQGDCGWVIEPENAVALADKMKEIVLLSKSELELKGNNGFKYALSHFSKKENLAKILKIINNVSPIKQI